MDPTPDPKEKGMGELFGQGWWYREKKIVLSHENSSGFAPFSFFAPVHPLGQQGTLSALR